MAKIIVAGDALVVESDYTLEDIKLLEKHNPKALSLYEEDGKTVNFKVGSTTGKGGINSYGASFGSASKNADKKAIITMDIPSDTEDVVDYAENIIGAAILKLNAVEAQFENALDAAAEEKASIRENITVM